jgi:hypothetical protein
MSIENPEMMSFKPVLIVIAIVRETPSDIR